ncbi:MAG: hypothetical protein R3C44_11925 [Chloroflexota bacterium]
MTRRKLLPLIALVSAAVLMSACGGTGETTPEPPAVNTISSVEQAVNQTVEAMAVAQTVAALTGGETPTAALPTATPLSAVTDEPPSPTPETVVVATEPPDVEPSPTTAPVPTDEVPPSCTTVTGVNVRSGPGTVYDPPVGTLAPNTVLTPLSYVARGFPQGEWLEAQVDATGQTVWITAGAQFVQCTIDMQSLPGPASIAPTPRPTNTPTPIPATATPTQVVAGLPPDVSNDVPGGACQRTDHIKTRIETDPFFLYRVYAGMTVKENMTGPALISSASPSLITSARCTSGKNVLPDTASSRVENPIAGHGLPMSRATIHGGRWSTGYQWHVPGLYRSRFQ